jgi:hypothetical protein
VLAAVLQGVSAARGDALYRGHEPLRGSIRGHDDLLPPETIICANCHNANPAARLSARPAPQLDAALLLQMRQRHGGPPSRYDRESFCRLLRNGSDPAYVLIAREMPAYDVTDEQCSSLWIFLTEKDGTHEAR